MVIIKVNHWLKSMAIRNKRAEEIKVLKEKLTVLKELRDTHVAKFRREYPDSGDTVDMMYTMVICLINELLHAKREAQSLEHRLRSHEFRIKST